MKTITAFVCACERASHILLYIWKVGNFNIDKLKLKLSYHIKGYNFSLITGSKEYCRRSLPLTAKHNEMKCIHGSCANSLAKFQQFISLISCIASSQIKKVNFLFYLFLFSFIEIDPNPIIPSAVIHIWWCCSVLGPPRLSMCVYGKEKRKDSNIKP